MPPDLKAFLWHLVSSYSLPEYLTIVAAMISYIPALLQGLTRRYDGQAFYYTAVNKTHYKSAFPAAFDVAAPSIDRAQAVCASQLPVLPDLNG